MRGRIVAVLALALVASCGGGEDEDLAFDSLPASLPETTVGASGPSSPSVPSESTVESVESSLPPPPTAPPATTVPRSWEQATGDLEGLPSECGNMHYVTGHPDGNTVIAGVSAQGLWSTDQGGGTWTRLGTGEGSAAVLHRPASIVFDPEDPATFWESGIYGTDAVFRTTDGGATFERLGDAPASDLVSIDFTDPERRTLLSGTHESPLVFRSGDGGSTWVDVSGSLPDGIGQAAAPHVIDAQTHLLGTKTGPEAGVFRTTDGATTWSRVHDAGVIGRPLVADGSIFWLVEGGGMITSTDAGATWAPVAGSAGVPAGPGSLIALPDGRMATTGGDRVIVSADSGATWEPIGATFPYSPFGLAYASGREEFFIWRFDCISDSDNPVPADAIMRLDVGGG